LLQGRMADYRWLELPLLDSHPSDEVGHEAHLLGHSMDLGIVSIDNAVTNSGEVACRDMQNKEIGRSWDGGGEQGVHGLAPGHFIGSGRAFPSSPRRWRSRSGDVMFALIEHESCCSNW
jgi:hypothetical protein